MTEAPSPLFPLLRNGLDPVPELGRVRAETPVLRVQIPNGPGGWLVTRYDDVRTVLADTARFSNDLGSYALPAVAEAVARWEPAGLGFHDPPEHTRLRRLLAPEFSARRLRSLRPNVEAVVARHLDAMERAGPPVDLVAAFALPIPFLVVCDLLGVPEAERAGLESVGDGRFAFSGDVLTSVAAIGESLAYLTDLVARQRANPGAGLLGRLVVEHGDELDDAELAGLADGLVTGGHDTTASMLALGTLLLLQNPEHAASVRDRDEDVDRVVDELLRQVTVVQLAFPRFARADTVLAGQPIKAGEMILCSLSAANRDGSMGTDTDQLNPAREGAPHLAFGHGLHHCVGAPLARLEMRIAYPALLRRFPGLRLAVPVEQLSFHPFSVIYGVKALPVEW